MGKPPTGIPRTQSGLCGCWRSRAMVRLKHFAVTSDDREHRSGAHFAVTHRDRFRLRPSSSHRTVFGRFDPSNRSLPDARRRPGVKGGRSAPPPEAARGPWGRVFGEQVLTGRDRLVITGRERQHVGGLAPDRGQRGCAVVRERGRVLEVVLGIAGGVGTRSF